MYFKIKGEKKRSTNGDKVHFPLMKVLCGSGQGHPAWIPRNCCSKTELLFKKHLLEVPNLNVLKMKEPL